MARGVFHLGVLLLLSGCVSRELAWCSAARPPFNFVGSSSARSFSVLQSAERLESASLGPAAAPSCLVSAYRHIVRQGDAPATFTRLFAQAGAARRIYALAGLYDTDRAAFERLAGIAQQSTPADLERIDGCIVTLVARQEVFAQLRNGELSARWRP